MSAATLAVAGPRHNFFEIFFHSRIMLDNRSKSEPASFSPARLAFETERKKTGNG
jgi:hypothetical protein